MHIPDGYLSPSTCATLYLFAASGWYAALKRIKQLLATRAIPLISVFAAFSFVVMMFNVPLPGGTTGHAVGVGIATVVLGPWGSILAISIALAIQALFFGDGGITTLGANCFNMAMVGSFTAYFVYRTIAANSNLKSRQRVLAAAVAGYVAINASALVTAVELGIQPMLFKMTAAVLNHGDAEPLAEKSGTNVPASPQASARRTSQSLPKSVCDATVHNTSCA